MTAFLTSCSSIPVGPTLPFTCGDLKTDTLGQVWAQFQKAWQSPRVSAFIDRLAEDPNIVSRLHQWEEVGAA